MKENVNFSVDYVIKRLKSLSNLGAIEGMAIERGDSGNSYSGSWCQT